MWLEKLKLIENEQVLWFDKEITKITQPVLKSGRTESEDPVLRAELSFKYYLNVRSQMPSKQDFHFQHGQMLSFVE